MYDYILENVKRMYKVKEERVECAEKILIEVKEIRKTIEKIPIQFGDVSEIVPILSTISCLGLIRSKPDIKGEFKVTNDTIYNIIIYNKDEGKGSKRTHISATIYQRQYNFDRDGKENSMKIEIEGKDYGSFRETFRYSDPKSSFEFKNSNICIEHAVKEIIYKFLDILEEIFTEYVR